MLSISNYCKEQLNNGNRNYLIKVEMTLRDATALTLTNEHIWDNGLTIEQATSNTDSFDIGSAIIGKCKLVINNINDDFSQYEFHNARFTVKLGIEGDLTSGVQRYYEVGVYTVDSAEYNGSLITLDCVDNMWKLDEPFEDINATYPISVRQLIIRICQYCSVSVNYENLPDDVMINNAPEGTFNCREVIQYIGQMCSLYFRCLKNGTIYAKWYNKNAVNSADADTPSTYSSFAKLESNTSSNVSVENIVVTGVSVKNTSSDDPFNIIVKDSTLEAEYPRYLLVIENNPFITSTNAQSVAQRVANNVMGMRIRAFSVNSLNNFSYEVGDPCTILDFRGNRYFSFITNLSFNVGNYETFSCGAEPVTQKLSTRYSNEVRTLVEASKNAKSLISDYDRAVNELNQLSAEAIGYNKYELNSNTGKITWLYSGAEIDDTDPANPTFPNSENVFKISGSGVFISKDGGTTYTNGYDANSGTAILNLIYALGINCDWIKAGTLTLGGNNNQDGKMEVYSGSNSYHKIMWSNQCAYETDFDYVQIFCETSEGLVASQKLKASEIKGKYSVAISDKFYIYWYTDSSINNYYGFSIDDIVECDTDIPLKVTYTSVESLPTEAPSVYVVGDNFGLVESEHNPYSNGARKLWYLEIHNESKLVSKLDRTGLNVYSGHISGCDIDIVGNGSLNLYEDEDKENLVGSLDRHELFMKSDEKEYTVVDSDGLKFGYIDDDGVRENTCSISYFKEYEYEPSKIQLISDAKLIYIRGENCGVSVGPTGATITGGNHSFGISNDGSFYLDGHEGQSGTLTYISNIRDNGDGTITWTTSSIEFYKGLMVTSI